MITQNLSPLDLYALSRAFVGLSIGELSVTNPLVAGLLTNINWSNPQQLGIARQVLKDYLPAILAVDPNGPPPATPELTQPDIYIPELLKAARLSDKALAASEQVGNWYKKAAQWTMERSPMTPPHFLEAGVVWLIGLAVNRRVCISLHEEIYPVMYYLLIAETSKYAKSTGMRALLALLMTAMPHMTIPGSTTTEGMIEMLSGGLPNNFEKLSKRDQELVEKGRLFAGQRGIMLDEYSSLLGSTKKDYMQGFVELLMRLYDCNPYETHYTKSGGVIMVKYPAFSIMGATTPAAMARALTYEAWENGAMARYLLMFRDEPMPYNPEYIPALPPESLITPLRRLHDSLPRITANDPLEAEVAFKPHYAIITKEAHQQYQRYMKAVYYDMIVDELDERLHGNYRRLHMQSMKIALALATMDWQESGQNGQVVIKLGHFALGQLLVEKARASLHRLMPVLDQSNDSRTQRNLLTILSHAPGGLTIRDVVRRTGRSTSETRSAIEVLVESGSIEAVEHVSHTGRPTTLYRVPQMSSDN